MKDNERRFTSCLLFLNAILIFSHSVRNARMTSTIEDLTAENAGLASTIVELSAQVEEQSVELESLYAVELSALPVKTQFQIAAEIYGLDWKIPYSIAAHETGWFKSRLFVEQNNPGGMKSGSSWAKFDNSFIGILEMNRLLKRSYIDKGLDTLEKMESKYCPDSSDWTNKVSAILSSLE